jgi:hypothetical protein
VTVLVGFGKSELQFVEVSRPFASSAIRLLNL